jgi:hypothetical protein
MIRPRTARLSSKQLVRAGDVRQRERRLGHRTQGAGLEQAGELGDGIAGLLRAGRTPGQQREAGEGREAEQVPDRDAGQAPGGSAIDDDPAVRREQLDGLVEQAAADGVQGEADPARRGGPHLPGPARIAVVDDGVGTEFLEKAELGR